MRVSSLGSDLDNLLLGCTIHPKSMVNAVSTIKIIHIAKELLKYYSGPTCDNNLFQNILPFRSISNSYLTKYRSEWHQKVGLEHGTC